MFGFGALRRRWKTTTYNKSNRQSIEFHANADEDDDTPDLAPPRFIEVEKGKISLVSTPSPPPRDFVDDATTNDKEVLATRIAELEDALTRLSEKLNQAQTEPSHAEVDLKKQLQSLNRVLKTKDRRTMEVCRDHKSLQSRFANQEACLQHLANENKHLQKRVMQYEHCLDDVMRKVVDAIVAEDNLREEVSMLKARVRDLEEQNATLIANNSGCSPSSSTGGGDGVNANVTPTSKARGDEGYCTMSSGSGAVDGIQAPPDHHLENLAEEDMELQHQEERFLANDESVVDESTSANMEDWSLSQEELGAALTYDERSWIWNSDNYLNLTIDSQSETISQLLQETISYSEDEEVTCKSFTREFYKLVDINSGSIRTLKSPTTVLTEPVASGHCETDSEDDDESIRMRCGSSPTPSEAGLALVTSCSSTTESNSSEIKIDAGQVLSPLQNISIEDELSADSCEQTVCTRTSINPSTSSVWRQSTGWRRISQNPPQQQSPQHQKPAKPPTTPPKPTLSTSTSISMIPRRSGTKIPTPIATRRTTSSLS